MAVAFRHLADIGFAENMAGHITWQPDGQSDMFVNPWGLWWQELTASDICVVDEDARVVRGRWDVTPAIHLHTELHRIRPDARVVIHNHPYYVSLIAALGTLPELVHQTGSLFLDDMYLVENYDGEIDAPGGQAELAQQIGSANLVDPGEPRRHRHRPQPGRGGLPGGVHRARLPAGLRRDAHRADPSKMNRGDMVGMQAVADRTRRRRLLGRRGPHDHQGRPRRSELEPNDDENRGSPMTSIDDMAANLNFTTAKTGADRTVTFLPEPERAERRYTVISVDDHIVEPPDTFDGRVPQQVRRPRPAGRRHRRRRPDVDVRRPVAAERRLQRGGRTAGVRVRLRAGPVRRNAPRRMGYPRTRQGHGPQRRLRVAELPVVPPGFRRPATAAGHQRPRPRDGLGAGVERLAHRGVGRRLSRPDHSVPAAVAARSRSRREDDLRERRTRIPRGDVQREPGDAGTADHPLRLLGAADGGVRRDRHGGEPAHRIVGHVAVDHRRRTARRAGRAVLRLRHLRGRRLAVLRACAPGTRT